MQKKSFIVERLFSTRGIKLSAATVNAMPAFQREKKMKEQEKGSTECYSKRLGKDQGVFQQ